MISPFKIHTVIHQKFIAGQVVFTFTMKLQSPNMWGSLSIVYFAWDRVLSRKFCSSIRVQNMLHQKIQQISRNH